MKETEYTDTNLLPPENKPLDVARTVFELVEKILDYKNELQLPQKWNRAYELTKNRHWKRKTKRAQLVSANLLFKHRRRTVNMLTDNNPIFDLSKIGMEEGQEESFDTMQKTCEFWWRNSEQQHLLEKSVARGEENGVATEKIVFDPEAEFGLGDVGTEIISPYNIGFWPCKQTVGGIQKKEGVFFYDAMNIREARRKWPDKADEIVTDDDILSKLGDTRQEAISGGKKGSGILTTFNNVVKRLMNDKGTSEIDAEDVLVVEAWVKDYTVVTEDVPVPVVDEQGNMIGEATQTIERPKYSGFIRMVTVCNGGKLVLEDRDNPSINPNIPREQAIHSYLYDKFPFIKAESDEDTASDWGISDYEQLDALMMEVNKTLSQLTLFKDKASRLKYINPQGSGVDNSEITNLAGIIRPTLQAAPFMGYSSPPEMPIDMHKLLEVYLDLFRSVAGSDVLEQAQQSGKDVIAYKAIAALLENASVMLRGKIRNYGKLIRDRGRMAISLMQHFYTEPRWIEFEDDNGDKHRAQVKGTEILFPAKLTVVSGSTMPRSKIQEREEARELHKMGVIDDSALLKSMEFPGWRAIVQRKQIGIIGMYIQRLLEVGLPEQVAEYFGQIAEMDDKEFEAALKKGEIPPFAEALRSALRQEPGGGPSPATDQAQNRELELKSVEVDAKARKMHAETMLTIEKIATERIKQMQAAMGVQFDRDKLAMERARLMVEIQREVFGESKELVDTALRISDYNEKGMASNNKVR